MTTGTKDSTRQLVQGEAIGQELKRFHPARILIVALDIGKDVHMALMRSAAGEVLLPPTKTVSLAEGYAWLKERIDRCLVDQQFDLVIIGHEPTGIYHENWSWQIAHDYAGHRLGQGQPAVRYRWLNPALVKQERQRRSQRRRKSDKIDVVAIGDLLGEGQGYPAPLLSQAESELRLLLGHLQHLEKRQRGQAIGLLRMLDRLWPGALGNKRSYGRTHPELPPLVHLVDSHPLRRQRLRVLLEYGPDPHRLRTLGVEGVRQLFQEHGHRCGVAGAQHILAVAQQSLLPPPEISAVLARQAQDDFALYRLLEQQIAAAEVQAVNLLPATSGQVLSTLDGVSALLAARYLAGLGNADRFQRPGQIWSFAGFDPVQADSGNRRFSGGISHRGSPYLRSTLFQIGHLTAQHCADCTRLYVQARQRGLDPTRATIHVANKANRILFALLKSQQPYRSPLSAEEQAYWRGQASHRR